MLSHQFYNVVHIVGIALAVAALAAMAVHALEGGTRAGAGSRRLVLTMHGLGLFLVLLGGFGMLARLGVQHGAGFPGWLWAKLIVWVTLGILAALPYRRRSLARPVLLAVPLLVGLAAYMAIYKPI